jgi:hypothetical protein
VKKNIIFRKNKCSKYSGVFYTGHYTGHFTTRRTRKFILDIVFCYKICLWWELLSRFQKITQKVRFLVIQISCSKRVKGLGAIWQIRIWALDEKLFTGYTYFLQYTIKVMFKNLGNFCNFWIYVLLLFYKILSSNLTFRI